MGLFRLFQLVIILSIFAINPVSAATAPALTMEDIKGIYSGIRDIKGSFIQRTFIKDLNRTETYKGSFIIKLPSMMKWKYGEKGDVTEVVIRGDEMIIYQERLKQAIRQRFDPDLYGQTPVALLSGLGSIDNDFRVEEKGGNLFLSPKKPMGGITLVELRPSSSEFPVGTLIMTDKRSNRIEIRLRDVRINTGAPDSLFEFSPPEGVRLQDLNRHPEQR